MELAYGTTADAEAFPAARRRGQAQMFLAGIVAGLVLMVAFTHSAARAPAPAAAEHQGLFVKPGDAADADIEAITDQLKAAFDDDSGVQAMVLIFENLLDSPGYDLEANFFDTQRDLHDLGAGQACACQLEDCEGVDKDAAVVHDCKKWRSVLGMLKDAFIDDADDEADDEVAADDQAVADANEDDADGDNAEHINDTTPDPGDAADDDVQHGAGGADAPAPSPQMGAPPPPPSPSPPAPPPDDDNHGGFDANDSEQVSDVPIPDFDPMLAAAAALVADSESEDGEEEYEWPNGEEKPDDSGYGDEDEDAAEAGAAAFFKDFEPIDDPGAADIATTRL